MPANPYQRKEISIEKLNALRTRLREAYEKSKKEKLPNAKNKGNAFYKGLIDDLDDKTGVTFSPGTIIKFLYDENRNYEVITVDTIEKYISTVMGGHAQEKQSTVIENKIPEERNSPEIKLFAKKIYIELITRKAAIPIDEDNDVIEEIYNSWYKLFCVIRDELHTLPADYLSDIGNPESVVGSAMKILNDILRPHLTEHQARYRHWLKKAKENQKNKNNSPQELQKKYPGYESLIKSIRQVNGSLAEVSQKMLGDNL